MRPASAEFGIRPRFGDRPISHAEWQTSTGAAGPPTGGSAARHIAKPMTTPVTVSQATNTRSPNNPAAAGHRRRARRSPGRSPGTTDFASRPGFPHDLGWGPLQNGRERDAGGPPSAQDGLSAGDPILVNASYNTAGCVSRDGARHGRPGPHLRARTSRSRRATCPPARA